MGEKEILKLVPTVQSIALLGDNLKAVKRPEKIKIVKQGVKNIVGINLIKETANIAASL